MKIINFIRTDKAKFKIIRKYKALKKKKQKINLLN